MVYISVCNSYHQQKTKMVWVSILYQCVSAPVQKEPESHEYYHICHKILPSCSPIWSIFWNAAGTTGIRSSTWNKNLHTEHISAVWASIQSRSWPISQRFQDPCQCSSSTFLQHKEFITGIYLHLSSYLNYSSAQTIRNLMFSLFKSNAGAERRTRAFTRTCTSKEWIVHLFFYQ